MHARTHIRTYGETHIYTHVLYKRIPRIYVYIRKSVGACMCALIDD